jgi:hypothetical protein
VRNALIISVIAHALFWGLNALHAPKPLASIDETPVMVDIVSPEDVDAAPKPENPETVTSPTKEAESQPLPVRQSREQPAPAQQSHEQLLPEQQSHERTAQRQQAAPVPAERTAPDSAPKVAQAAWDPRQSLPAGTWLDSALGAPVLAANAFDPAETVANLSQQEIAALKARLKECWKPPAGVADTEDLVVMLRVSLKPDGTLRDEPAMLAASASENGPALLRTAASALRQCQPYSFLPAAKYKEWKILDLSFSPTGLSTKRIAPVL